MEFFSYFFVNLFMNIAKKLQQSYNPWDSRAESVRVFFGFLTNITTWKKSVMTVSIIYHNYSPPASISGTTISIG